MRKKAQLLVLVWLGLVPVTIGHPVSFKGGWSFMAFHQSDMIDWQLLYTIEPKVSLGVDFIRDTMDSQERFFLIPRVSWLVHRWNQTESQANLYFYGGIGVARMEKLSEPAVQAAIEGDYETRALYLSGRVAAVTARRFNTLALYQLRAGFAPYLGEADELHTWLIGQLQYLPFAPEEAVRFGPVLRLFYKNVLWETGVSTQGNLNFNFMVHW